ncbi:MAG: hypothetical protein MUE51_09010, partial [Thermoleophilia bacterium]|nr:hypothetical protein [Thermoleophilia bacterium]
VRQHLQTMAAVGLVQTSRDAPSGRGRPSNRFRLVDPDAPQRAAHEELVTMLMGIVARAGLGEEQVRAIGRERGAADPSGVVDPHRAVADVLARLGFAPREVSGAADRRAGTSRLVLGSCPFREAVAHPGGHLVCALHHGLLEGAAQAADPSATVPEFVPRDPAAAGCTVAVSAPVRD